MQNHPELDLAIPVKSAKDSYLTNMFAKVFSQIFDSSIAENYQTRHVFTDLLVLADIEGVVDMTLAAVSRRTNVPLEIVSAAIEELQKPDPYSRTKGSDGRRIEMIDPSRGWGWRIVNYAQYRELRDNESRRAYFRDQQRIQRLRNTEPKSSTQEDGEVDAESDREELLREAKSLEEFTTRWNQIPSLPKVRKLTPKRKTSLRVRLKDADFLQNWQEALAKVQSSPFCCGQNERGWQATMDWFIQPETLNKIMEGKYDRRGKSPVKTIPLRPEEEPEITKL